MDRERIIEVITAGKYESLLYFAQSLLGSPLAEPPSL